MKKWVANKVMDTIKKNFTYDEVKMLEIKYGIESIYLLITKTIVILSLAFILGIFKELLLLLIFYSIIRATGFGVHAKKPWHCWSSSLLIFLGIPILSTQVVIPKIIGLIVSIICLALIIKYAPADTEKRPIVSIKRRYIYKFLCSLTCVIYSIIFLLTNSMLGESTFFSIIIETLMILPITYKLFDVKYNNYKIYLQHSLSK